MIRLFGPTTIVTAGNGGCATHITGKHGRLLAVLGMQNGQPISKDRLADYVWDGQPPPSYRQALDSDVCVLRRRGGLGPGRSSALATTAVGYVLDPERVLVDLTAAQALARQAQSEPSAAALRSTAAALGLASRPLLEDEPYAAWAEDARTTWQSTAVELLLSNSRAALVRGDPEQALRSARRAVELRPHAEGPAVQLMRALWWSGQRLEALRVFLELRQSMLDELGEQPGADVLELYLTILREDASSPIRGEDSRDHLRLLLKGLRETLDLTPGLRAPALDAELAAAASAALTGPGRTA